MLAGDHATVAKKMTHEKVLGVNLIVFGEVEILLGHEYSLCHYISLVHLKPLIR